MVWPRDMYEVSNQGFLGSLSPFRPFSRVTWHTWGWSRWTQRPQEPLVWHLIHVSSPNHKKIKIFMIYDRSHKAPTRDHKVSQGSQGTTGGHWWGHMMITGTPDHVYYRLYHDMWGYWKFMAKFMAQIWVAINPTQYHKWPFPVLCGPVPPTY